MSTVAVIGLGEMGLPMARNLAAKGFQVVGYDVREEPGRMVREAGGRVAASGGEAAADADAIVVMVRTPAQAEAVVVDAGGVLDRARRGSMLIVMSTVGVSCMRRLADAARGRGLRFLDAPVSGGRERAEARTLTIIVGGTSADVEAGRPMLEAMGSRIAHVGDAGAGTAVKMANQVLLSASLVAAREMAALIEASGVTPEAAWDVIRTCTGTTWVVEHWPIASGWLDRSRPGSSLDILMKDTGLAVEMARDAGIPAPVLGLVAQTILGLTRSRR